MGCRALDLRMAMMSDSRQYRYSFRLKTPADVPDDFLPLPFGSDWDCAALIPGETQNSWEQSAYPPRIYAVYPGRVAVYPHPSSGQTAFSLALQDLYEIEYERALLSGELTLHGRFASGSFRYNTVHHRQIRMLLSSLRNYWMRPGSVAWTSQPAAVAFRKSQFPCWNALQAEIDPGEEILWNCYKPAQRIQEKGIFSRTVKRSSGYLLAITSRRIILIGEEVKSHSDPFGIRVRYRSIFSMASVEARRDEDGDWLMLLFDDGSCWKGPCISGLSSSKQITSYVDPQGFP
jgi:hypothetical protein